MKRLHLLTLLLSFTPACAVVEPEDDSTTGDAGGGRVLPLRDDNDTNTDGGDGKGRPRDDRRPLQADAGADGGGRVPTRDGGATAVETDAGSPVTPEADAGTSVGTIDGGAPRVPDSDLDLDNLNGAGESQTVVDESTQELTFDIPDGIDGTSVVVILKPKAGGGWRPVASTLQAGAVTVIPDSAGRYRAVAVDQSPPADCQEDTWDGSLAAGGNLDVAQLAGYTRLQGNLTIKGKATDLSALRCLTEITGNLDISGASMLTQAPLPNLVRVRGRIQIHNNSAMLSISAPRLRLVGSLSVSSLPELTNLHLPGLVSTSGPFSVRTVGATADAPLSVGLDWLVQVGGALTIDDATNLEGLDSLTALQAVSGTLDVRNCPALSDGSGLSEVRRVGGLVVVYNNAELTAVSLASLTAVGAAGRRSLTIQTLPELTSLNLGALRETPAAVYLYQLGATADDDLAMDLSSLAIIRGGLDIQQVTNLPDLNGLVALREVAGTIDVRTNAALTDATGLAALETVAGRVVIYNNGELAKISLGSLVDVGTASRQSLNIQALPELVSLDIGSLQETPSTVYLYQLGKTADDQLSLDLSSLRIIRANLDLQQISNLPHLDGLSALEEVSGAVDIRTNEGLVDAGGLAALKTTGGRLMLYNNPLLTTIALTSLTSVGATSSHSLTIQALPELTSLDVRALKETPSQIYLNDLGGSANGALMLNFAALSIVRSTFTLYGIDNLPTANAFAALEEISASLVVQNNVDLLSLAGFDNLQTVGGNLNIRNNPLLSECAPQLLRNRLQAGGFDGTATISGNMADTCN